MQEKEVEWEVQLIKRVQEAKQLAKEKEREVRQFRVLDETIRLVTPLAGEAHAIASELDKGLSFSVEVMAISDLGALASARAADESRNEKACIDIYDDDDDWVKCK